VPSGVIVCRCSKVVCHGSVGPLGSPPTQTSYKIRAAALHSFTLKLFTSDIVVRRGRSLPIAERTATRRQSPPKFLEIVMIVNFGLRGDGQVGSGERFHSRLGALLQSAADVHSGGSEAGMMIENEHELHRKPCRHVEVSVVGLRQVLEAATLKLARKWLRWSNPPVRQRTLCCEHSTDAWSLP
jgi:hypothetical protein